MLQRQALHSDRIVCIQIRVIGYVALRSIINRLMLADLGHQGTWSCEQGTGDRAQRFMFDPKRPRVRRRLRTFSVPWSRDDRNRQFRGREGV